jgi:uncharacterized protein (DUF2384 family)
MSAVSTSLSTFHAHDPMARIDLIRAGLPARSVGRFAADLGISKEGVYELLGVTRATGKRWARDEKPLSPEATERAVFVAGLVQLVEDMIPEKFGLSEGSRGEVRLSEAFVGESLDHPDPMRRGTPVAMRLVENDGFEAAKWVAQWLQAPQPALGGKPPKSYLDTADGRDMVRNLLAQMESGAYA